MTIVRPAMLVAAAALVGGALATPVPGQEKRDGAAVFRAHCAQCHGARADGNGILASRYTPRPSNLLESKRSDEYRLQIITLGGANLGRSPVMPEWGLEISGQEILAVVEYLRELSNQHAARERAPAAQGGTSRADLAVPHG